MQDSSFLLFGLAFPLSDAFLLQEFRRDAGVLSHPDGDGAFAHPRAIDGAGRPNGSAE